MKNINIIQKIFSLLICLYILSCSNEVNDIYDQPEDDTKESNVNVSIGTLSLPAGLKCDLYIFWKSLSDTDYTFKNYMTLTSDTTTIRFMNNELKDKEYKFLFVATSDIDPEIIVSNKTDNALSVADKWSDVKITGDTIVLSADNYSGIVDKTGDDILNGGSIDGVLTRMVGQIVLDIFRTNGSVTSPTHIVSPDVASVLDRVYKIDIEYTDITQNIIFDASNEIVNNDSWTVKHVQTIDVTTDANLKVTIPQPTNNLEDSPANVLGSVRIKGICCLPSQENMSMKLTFYYYDTTPTCGNSDGGDHTLNCYEKGTLVLNLPKDEAGYRLLSVYPDYFTVNKAGIRLDRIIDLKQPGSFELLTTWDN